MTRIAPRVTSDRITTSPDEHFFLELTLGTFILLPERLFPRKDFSRGAKGL
jgi:hypothetical protein